MATNHGRISARNNQMPSFGRNALNQASERSHAHSASVVETTTSRMSGPLMSIPIASATQNIIAAAVDSVWPR
jgi:hypothetical protein